MQQVYEINREIVVSTSHIALNTSKWLKDNQDSVLSIYDYEYGWRILVSSSELNSSIQWLWANGMGELAELMRLAADNECKWLMLDCDGPELIGRPKFEWDEKPKVEQS